MQKKFSSKDSGLSFILALLLPSVLAIFVLMLAGFFTDITKIETTTFYKIFSVLINEIVFIAIFLLFSTKKKVGVKPLINKKLNFSQIFILILISLTCLFLITPLMNVYDEFLTFIGLEPMETSINLSGTKNLIFYIFSLGILAPIGEELIFRGIILNGLEEKGTKKAVLLSGFMFMLMHLNVHQTLYQFILGVILALVVVHTQNIFSSILIHFINNTSILLINYFSPQFFDFKFLSVNFIIIALACFLVGTMIIVYLLDFLKAKSKKQIAKFEFEKEKENSNMVKISLILASIFWIVNFVLYL